MSNDRPTALVTGASSGIGAELARVLAREGHELVLVARREAELDALAEELKRRYGAQSTVVPADLSDGAGPALVADAVDGAGIELDVLVNNAGFGDTGRFWETDPAKTERMLAVNVVALTALTRRFLPGMCERRHGHVLNVASTAAFQPGPYMSVYYASKAYVLSFTEALAEELQGTGVSATALCPGVVPSGFQDASNVSHDAAILHTPAVKSAEFVAEAAYAAMIKGKAIVIPGALNMVGVQSLRLAPRRVVVKVAKRLHQPD
ncbi:MAG TPA: SDR family oxidoreductase [Mycobacteriales bacterium]|nr:SDR family oxidoreductase [Mycobacteriales bacterium]